MPNRATGNVNQIVTTFQKALNLLQSTADRLELNDQYNSHVDSETMADDIRTAIAWLKESR